MVSASIAGLIALTQLAAALGKAPNALPLDEVLQGLGIDFAAIGIFAFLFKQDWQARNKQIARLGREEGLGALQLELANRKVLRMAQLRGFARAVVVAGSQQQVADALQAAEPFKAALIERGVLVIPLPIFEEEARAQANAQADSGAAAGSTSSSGAAGLSKPGDDDLRWRATPLRQGEWKAWFTEQMSLAGAQAARGLYIGLRLDGRVRASGQGPPPWARFAGELAPMSGMWQGLFDGFDGKV